MNSASQPVAGAAAVKDVMLAAARDLYNPAQLEVLYRAHLIATDNNDQVAALEAALDAKSADDAV